PDDFIEVFAHLAVDDIVPALAVLARGPQAMHTPGHEEAIAEGQRDERRANALGIGMVFPGQAIAGGDYPAGGADADKDIIPIGDLAYHLLPALPFLKAILAGVAPALAIRGSGEK